MPSFFTAHTPDFNRNHTVFPEIGDKLWGGSNLEHMTVNYFDGEYSEEAKGALRKVCAFLAPFEIRTDKPILVGRENDMPAASVSMEPELLALHALSIAAIEHVDPAITADRSWFLQKYNPHMTFYKNNDTGLYIGEIEEQSLIFGGITVWQRAQDEDDYTSVDKIRLKGEMYYETTA